MDQFSKQPSEAFAHEVSFVGDLETGESISSAVVTSVDQTGADSTATVIAGYAVTATTVKVELQNGTDGEQHTGTIVATTDLGHVIEHDFIMNVVELP